MPNSLNDIKDDSSKIFALYKVSNALGLTDDPKTALKKILDEIVSFFKCNSASIALINPDTDLLELEVSVGLPEDFQNLQLPLLHGVTGWVASYGKPLIVPDVKKESRYFQVKKNICSEIAVPMKQDDSVIGVINLDSTKLDAFSSDDLKFLELLSNEATRVMAGVWRNNHLELKADHLKSLVNTGNSLVSQLDLEAILENINREAHQIMDCQLCAIYMLTPETGRLKLRTISGAKTEVNYNEELELKNSSVGVAITRKKQVQVLNLTRTEEHHFAPLVTREGLVSLLSTPIIYDDQVIGVINIYMNHQHRFDDDEKTILLTLATLGAVAIQNVRLYQRVFDSEESLRKNERLTTLGLIAAEIAHEIRNPLTVIKLLFETLELDFNEDDPKRNDTRIILEKLVHLEQIVERVLNFGKTNEEVHTQCYLHTLIENTLLLVRLKLKQCNIDLQYEPCKSPLWLMGNQGQLQQVILNLIINALQAMPQGGSIKIRTSSKNTNDAIQAVIDFFDTGTGVPKAIQSQIFDSFLSNKREGTGLGLSIVKRILKSHNGDIEMIDSSSEGTHFQIHVPASKQKENT